MFAGPGEMFDPDNPGAAHDLYSVAVSVFDGGDGIFDTGDSLMFYGLDLWHWNFQSDSIGRSFHRYDDANTYWLTWGGADGARIQQEAAPYNGGIPIQNGTVAFGFEEEVLSDTQNDRTGWLWAYLFGSSPGYFYLSSPFTSDNATIRLGLTNSGAHPRNHTVRADLEGVTILDSLSSSRRNEVFTIEDVAVESGGNMLKVWNDYEYSAFLDFVDIMVDVDPAVTAGYLVFLSDLPGGDASLTLGPVSPDTRIFDLTDPFNPVELTGWSSEGNAARITVDFTGTDAAVQTVEPSQYMGPVSIQPAQPGRILGSASSADVLVAVPEELAGGSSYIESVFSRRDVSVCIVTYREIYDEFGQGVSDPGAVRSFVRWALDTWPEPPEMLMLVGDGSDDPLGFTTGSRTLAPVYVGLPSGRTEESFFTTVHEDSDQPEIPYCRIPASTMDELLVAMQKSDELTSGSILGPWANTVVLAADDEWGQQLTEDDATISCEYLADSVLNPSLNIEKLYLIAYPWPPGTTGEGIHPTKPEAAQDLVALFNSGISSFSFFGHGSYDQMAQEKLFSSGMVTQLFNSPRCFLYNSFSCDNGKFTLSAGDCLSEILLFHPTGGSAVNLACTGGSFSNQNKLLSSSFLGYVYGEDQLTVAEAFWLTVIEIQDDDNLLYSLLGDGGITVPMAEDDMCSATAPDTLFRGRINSVAVEFPEETSFLFRCKESAGIVHYVSPLSENFSIDYLRYGASIYTGMAATDESGTAAVDFFVPLQADTGSMGRADATGPLEAVLGTGYSWPVPIADDGEYTDDTEGPDIQLSFRNCLPGDIPSVYQNAELYAVLSDPSGICVLGSDAGSIIICSIDGEYEDVTELFSFNTGSYTTGSFEYTLPELLPGQHQVRVVARDGMKNTGENSLVFNMLEGPPPLLEKTGIYPNPGRGTRAFFFTTGSAGTVSASVYTIAGRPVWQGEKAVSPGVEQIVWDGLDADGDAIAAGSYIYVLKFSGGSGTCTVTDLMVVRP